jgi:hypothetical protein
MQKRRISADVLSKVLAVGAIGLFAIGHFLPFGLHDNLNGWRLVTLIVEFFWESFGNAWANKPPQGHWQELLFVVFLPLFVIGVAGFFAAARSRPRMAGLIAALSGLCSMGSMTFWWLTGTSSEIPAIFFSGFYVWFASMGLLFAAGVCKLEAVGSSRRHDPLSGRLPSLDPLGGRR